MTPDHPSFDRLVDLVKGDLSPDRRTEIAAHVAACPECAADVAWLEQILVLYRTQVSVSAPASAIAHVNGLFKPPVPAERPEPLRRILALLAFDSAHKPPASGLRSSVGPKRQLVFRAAEFDLDIHVVSNGSRCIISGQVLGCHEAGHAELQGQAGMLHAPLNHLCQFMLPPVAAGTYTLIVRMKDTLIEVPQLDVGT
jgi:hypothetical protein